MTKLLSFSFEYLPAIPGAALVVEYLPQSVFRMHALDRYLQVQNVSRLKRPYDVSRTLVKVGDRGIAPVSKVLSSDGTTTALRVSVSLPASGERPEERRLALKVFHSDMGPDNAANVSVTIMDEPAPTILSFYPTQSASELNTVRLIIAYLPVESDLSAPSAPVNFLRKEIHSTINVARLGRSI